MLEGWRKSTIDVDLYLEPETDELLRALPALKDRLDINRVARRQVDRAATNVDGPPKRGSAGNHEARRLADRFYRAASTTLAELGPLVIGPVDDLVAVTNYVYGRVSG